MKTKIRGKVIVFLLLTLSGCTYAKHKRGQVPEGTTNICVSQIDYTVIQKTIVGPKCVGCHDAGSGLIPLETYANVIANIGRVQAAVQAGTMPKGNPLPQNEKDLLTAWIGAGTPETVAQDPNACNDATGGGDPIIPIPTLKPNFESIHGMILEPRCIGCHDQDAAHDFTTYASITSYRELFISAHPGEDPSFVDIVAVGAMPPKKLPKLSAEEVEVIRQWVILGLPEKEGSPGIVINPPVEPPPVVEPPPIVDPLPPELSCLDFQTVNTKVFQPKCVGCHGGAGGVDLDSYANVKANLAHVESMISADKMPPKKPLDAALKEQVLAWIKNGAPETSTCAKPPPVEEIKPLEATYNSMKTHFLEAKCIVCHNGARKKGGDDDDDDDFPDFSTYQKMISNKKLFDFKKPHKSDIVDEVMDGDMPPPSSSVQKLTQVEIQTLIEWIDKGLPEG